MSGYCNICGDECTNRCSKCKSVFYYCSVNHQREDWKKNHKPICPTSPPHSIKLLIRAQEADFECGSINIAYNDEKYDLLNNLCNQIYDNASWCQHNCSLTVLLDATRALRVIHEKAPTPSGGNGNIPDQLWNDEYYMQGMGSTAWNALADAWMRLIRINGKHLKSDIARELYLIHQDIRPVGWDQLEPVINAESWPGMAHVLRESSKMLPRADPTKIDIKADFVECLKEKMEDDFAFGIYSEEGIAMLKTFIESDRLDEYLEMAVKWHSELWNSSMKDINPTQKWSAAQLNYWGGDAMDRQWKLAEIVGLEFNDIEDMKHTKGALRFVFLEVEKRFRWCFEDAVDPDELVGVHRARYF